MKCVLNAFGFQKLLISGQSLAAFYLKFFGSDTFPKEEGSTLEVSVAPEANSD